MLLAALFIAAVVAESLADKGVGYSAFALINGSSLLFLYRKMRKEDMEDQHRRREMKERHDDRRSERRARNDAIRKKYGRKKN